MGKHTEKFLVDYIDKRVRIVAENYTVARAMVDALTTNTLWENVQYDVKRDTKRIKPYAGSDISRGITIIASVTIVITANADCTTHLELFIPNIERLHKEYVRAITEAQEPPTVQRIP